MPEFTGCESHFDTGL